MDLTKPSFSKEELRIFFEEEVKRLRRAKKELYNKVAKRPLLAKIDYVESLIQLFDEAEQQQ